MQHFKIKEKTTYKWARKGAGSCLLSSDHWKDVKKWLEAVSGDISLYMKLGKGTSCSWELEQASQESGLSTKPDRVQKALGQHSQTRGVTLGVSCAGPGAGL